MSRSITGRCTPTRCPTTCSTSSRRRGYIEPGSPKGWLSADWRYGHPLLNAPHRSRGAGFPHSEALIGRVAELGPSLCPRRSFRLPGQRSERVHTMKIKAAVLNRMGAPRPYAESKPLSITQVDLD